MLGSLVRAHTAAASAGHERQQPQISSNAILFVTDELFLPRAHNGSANVYVRTAQDAARLGSEIFCVSFFQQRRRAVDPQVTAAYASLFSAFLLLPGWNGGGTLLGRLGLGYREVNRWITGNIFAGNRMLEALLQPRLDEILRFAHQHAIDTVYFHKPQTVMLLAPILRDLRPARLVVELHDDFVERGLQYQRAYRSFFSSVSAGEIARSYWKSWLRLKFYRVDEARSRKAEADILAGCDQVIVASEVEYRRYRESGRLCTEFVYQARRLANRAPSRSMTARMEFNAGFIGSDDVMNLDAVNWFCREILPRIRRERPEFKFLVAGTIARHAGRLLRRVAGAEVWPSLDDVRLFYEAVEIVVVPLRYGTGTSIKVHEALAFGRPIVSTSVGVRGICAAELDGVWIADDADRFSAGVIERLRSRVQEIP